MNPVRTVGIFGLIAGAIGGLILISGLLFSGPSGPESDPKMRSPMRMDLYHFEAKLVDQPDKHKLLQWSAVPLSDHWTDTLLIDFDYGPGIADQQEGDVVWLVSEYNAQTQTWDYWTAEHWKQIRLPDRKTWR